jgi:hypothetical protein
LGEERELYQVTVKGSSGTVELESAEAHLTISSSTLASLGSGAASIHVRQIGNNASSRPASAEITLA